MRTGAPERHLCIEAQVMDLSDDIAYSVHDFEDAIVNGYVDVAALGARVDHDALVSSMYEWIGGAISHDELIAAFDRLDSLEGWMDTWSGSRREQGRLKNLTSQLIGRFAHAATEATRSAFTRESLIRFGADVVVPREIQAEIAVLKGIVAAFVMSKNTRQPIYTQQRQVLTSLAEVLHASGDRHLDAGFAEDWRGAGDDAARKRVIVDQIASLTDQSALAWYERLVQR
jgi:dGTPase